MTEQERPSVLFRPYLTKWPNEWMAFYPDGSKNPFPLHGIYAVGNTPEEAMRAFDKKWIEEKARQ